MTSAAAVCGLGHTACKLPCQDAVLEYEDDEICILALADGAGSASLSDIGAKIVVDTVTKLLINSFDSLYYDEESESKNMVITAVLDELAKVAGDAEKDIKEYASTLLSVAVKGERYIAIHVGDGVIGAMVRDDLLVISHPDNGEHANETTFVSSINALNSMRFLKGRAASISGFVLMSDGSEQSLYDKSKKTVVPAVVKLFTSLIDMPRSIFAEELDNLLENQIKQRTSDDCSIALMARDRKRLRHFHQKLIRGAKSHSAQ